VDKKYYIIRDWDGGPGDWTITEAELKKRIRKIREIQDRTYKDYIAILLYGCHGTEKKQRMELSGKHFDDSVFNDITAKWEHIENTTWKCTDHNVIFDSNDEPCWECWDKCWIDV